MKIREITPQDAGDFIQLLNQVDLESEYMLMEPGTFSGNGKVGGRMRDFKIRIDGRL
ncbi:hypothetical protein [Siminovitchia acidinfaciens]|uniref:hypothetical protein n=1 Tax=Siminovitchia acidinfaciens TaxID=2321395 RepID=UPI0013DFB9A6|nr:hypothetical protein [Siminovitchia acidinfaciens]